MKLYVVRHGETNENIDHIMQGHMDTLLNDNGINQAIKVRDEIKKNNINIDLIISSPLKRAKDTANIISNNEIPIIVDNRLISRDHGEFQGMIRGDIDLEGYWNFHNDNKYKKAENVKHIYERVVSLLEDIRKNYKGKTVLLTTHSGVCRILYYYFTGIPQNGDLLEYEAINGLFEEYILED